MRSLHSALRYAPPRLATVYSAGQFSLAARKMGRQAASGGLLQALIASEPHPSFRVLLPPGESPKAVEEVLARQRPELQLHAQRLLQPGPPADMDVLLMSDPLLGRLAHWREWQGCGARAYSLIGITHTLCSLPVLEGLRAFATAPVQPWDALICTSSCAREAVSIALDWEEERLRRRFVAPQLRLPRPRLPLIPLGCDVERLARLRQRRQEARQSLGIGSNQVVLLYVGRLALHAKAHPVLLLETLARLASRQPQGAQPVRLLLYGTAPPAQRPSWKQALQALTRGYEVQMLDGEDESLADQVWAAADIFVSLADNLQETFGLTPVEAMACGLPVIATDWNGYRDTVRHGETGLLVPTRQPADGLVLQLARYGLGLIDYDAYVGRLMQEVVVDGDALLDALERLVGDGELRQQLGEAGQRRAAQNYAWPLLGRRIRDLAASLGRARERAVVSDQAEWPLPPPEMQFASWASASLTPHTRFGGDPLEARRRWQRLASLQINQFPQGLRSNPRICDLLLCKLEKDGGFSPQDVSNEYRELSLAELCYAANWLAKLGVLEVN